MLFLNKQNYKQVTVQYVIVCLFFILTSCGIKELSSKVNNKSTPEVITLPNNTSTVNPLIVNKMAAGDDFTCASGKISDNSQSHPVYCWGGNSSNQLATSTASNPQRVPVAIPELLTKQPIFSLSAAFGCILKSDDDSISCWGKNDQFQLGNSQQTSGNRGLGLINVDEPNSELVTFASAGAFHSCFYTTNKMLQCIGNSWNGSLGPNTLIAMNTTTFTPINIPGATPINLSIQNLISSHINNYLLMNDGSVACFGRNFDGACGLGNTISPVGISWMVLPTGVLAKEVVGLQLATCILSLTNQVYCTGNNTTIVSGILGDNTATSKTSLSLATTLAGVNVRSLAVQTTGPKTNCIITQSGGVKCWGGNTNGAVGNNTFTTPQMFPQDVVDATNNPINQVTSLILKDSQTNDIETSACALRVDGSVWCWGRGGHGQLGNNSTANSSVAVRAQLPSSAKRIFAGIRSACALLNNDSLFCWGANFNGKLGINNVTNSSIPRQVFGIQNKVQNIIGGVNHTCAHLVDGMLQCWGGNLNGVLGMSDLSINRYVPTSPFPFYGGTWKVNTIATGASHTCILILDGYPKCFGNNQSGQLGIGTNVSTPTPNYPLNIPTLVSQLALGENHSCFLGKNGLVYCAGDNTFGQLGIGQPSSTTTPAPANISDVVSLASGKNHVCAILSDKSTWCWGNNTFGQLALGKSSRTQLLPARITGINETLTQVTAGRSHTCGLSVTNKVYCWGLNLSGQLGTGTYINALVPKPVVGLDNLKISEVIAGANHTCAKTTDNQMFCWGENEGGQLGNNTLTKSNVPVLVTLP